MRYVYRYEGDVIIKKGEVAETYYLIKTGEVACVNEGFYICTLSQGMALGEQALYVDAQRQLDVIVESDNLELLELTRTDMQSKKNFVYFSLNYKISYDLFILLGQLKCDNVRHTIQQNYLQWGFEKSIYFSKLNRSMIEIIKAKMVCVEYPKGTVLLAPDEFLKKMFFLVEGEMEFIHENKNLKNISIQKGYTFGEDFLIPRTRLRSPVAGTLSMKQNGYCCEISLEELNKILNGDMEKIMKSLKNQNSQVTDLSPSSQGKVDVKVENLIFLKFLGDGILGQIYLVRLKNAPINSNFYVVKVISLRELESINGYRFPIVRFSKIYVG